MAHRLILAAVIVAAVAVLAVIARRRRTADAPVHAGEWAVPTQLDRADFAGRDRPWLVVVFSSRGCEGCAAVIAAARVLASAEVSFEDVEYGSDRRRHRRYRIEAVPTTLIADSAGVVRRSHLGPVSATDLWADLARLRGGEGAGDRE